MTDYLLVLGLACLPALGNFGGGVLAEFLRPSRRMLNRALHAAAGIIIAVVAVEVMPEALEATPAWAIAGAFLLGGGFYMLIEWAIERWQERSGGGDASGATAMWMVYVAIAADLFGDGLLIGTGSAVSPGLALVLALGQVLADIPEGYAGIANFRDKGVPRGRRLLLSASFAVPVLLAATLAYFLLRGQSEAVKKSEAVKMSALVFTAGLYTLAAVEDMVAEAHESAEDTRLSALSFLGGFALFTLVSGYFEAG